MSKFTQKRAKISLRGKLEEQNGHEISQKKQSTAQKSVKNKPKKQANSQVLKKHKSTKNKPKLAEKPPGWQHCLLE